jgi:hypothetical protein
VAQILARHASVAVASVRSEENLAHAVDARKLVGQAMGILMERSTSTPTAPSPSSGATPKTPTPSCATSPSS